LTDSSYRAAFKAISSLPSVSYQAFLCYPKQGVHLIVEDLFVLSLNDIGSKTGS